MSRVKAFNEEIRARRNAEETKGRVSRKKRMVYRPQCCACEGTPGVTQDGTRCHCGHVRFVLCDHLTYDSKRDKPNTKDDSKWVYSKD